jgi:hypothetical protein
VIHWPCTKVDPAERKPYTHTMSQTPLPPDAAADRHSGRDGGTRNALIAAAAVIIAALIGAVVVVAPWRHTAITTFTVTPSYGVPGQVILAQGSGFLGREQVLIRLGGTPVAGTRVDSAGRFQLTFGVPAIPSGPVTATAHGESSHRSAQTPFTVRGGGETSAPPRTTPPIGGVWPSAQPPGAIAWSADTPLLEGGCVDLDTGEPDCTGTADLQYNLYNGFLYAYEKAQNSADLGPKTPSQLAAYDGPTLRRREYGSSTGLDVFAIAHAFAVRTDQGNYAVVWIVSKEEGGGVRVAFATFPGK